MRLSQEQVQQYMDDGFLVVENVFSKDELQPVMDWFDTLVDDCAERLYAAGMIGDKHEGEDTYTRLWSLEQQWPGAAAFVTQRNSMGPALAALCGGQGLRRRHPNRRQHGNEGEGEDQRRHEGEGHRQRLIAE